MWHFKDIFRELEALLKWFEAFLQISFLFEDIFREIEAFFEINVMDFQKLRGFLNTFLVELSLF
jgi:hypothetical protein